MKVISIEQTCGACPSQWEGITDDNRRVYVRYRWGNLSVRVGEIDDMQEFAAVRGNEVFALAHGDGFLEYSELVKLTKGEIEWPIQQSC